VNQLFESGPMRRAQNDLINIPGDLEVDEKSLLDTYELTAIRALFERIDQGGRQVDLAG